jgi:hypothetical protein
MALGRDQMGNVWIYNWIKICHPGGLVMTMSKLAVCILLPVAVVAVAQSESGESIGVYDSRSIAMAYAGTDMFTEKLQELRSKRDAAEAAGDKELAAKLDEEGAAMQHEMHLQGFSTAPVDEIIELIEDKLPAIMEKHAVSAIVCKWDETALADYPDANRINVTMDLVDALNPNERQRQFAEEVQAKRPMPLKKAKKKLGKDKH